MNGCEGGVLIRGGGCEDPIYRGPANIHHHRRPGKLGTAQFPFDLFLISFGVSCLSPRGWWDFYVCRSEGWWNLYVLLGRAHEAPGCPEAHKVEASESRSTAQKKGQGAIVEREERGL